MATVNSHYQKLQSAYLFSEIEKRTKQFLGKNPRVEILRLGIGDTTQPLPRSIIKGLKNGVLKLAKTKTYSGYGDYQGNLKLRQALVNWYARRNIALDHSEIFISDGAKTDSTNISSVFGTNNIIAVQDPVYPVYVDSTVIAGRTGKFVSGLYEGIVYMNCTKENGFFPEIPKKKVDVIFLCSPNNPTGIVATKIQLQKFIDYARKYKAIIIFDAAYSAFIKDTTLPKSIYEIKGAKTCAIEINSFSKWAGFTGVRLGWMVIPKDLIVEDAKPGIINALWYRHQSTITNGVSNIVQEGGLAVLTEEGQKECRKIIDYYMKNAAVIKNTFQKLGFEVFGGENAPYVWVKTPNKLTSWEFFDQLLQQARVVSIPGSGFGPRGEGYIRLSAFGHADNVKKAVKSIEENLKL